MPSRQNEENAFIKRELCEMKDIIVRNHVKVIGEGEQTIVFAHGFGCDQSMWQYITPSFEKKYRIVLFDYVGSGNQI